MVNSVQSVEGGGGRGVEGGGGRGDCTNITEP